MSERTSPGGTLRKAGEGDEERVETGKERRLIGHHEATAPDSVTAEAGDGPSMEIERFLPRPDVRKRHETLVHAPPGLVLDVARNFDLSSIPVVRWIFWMRSRLLGARTKMPQAPGGALVATMRGLGWGVLAEVPGRLFIAGAACQPWRGDVVFTAIPPARFASFAAPDQVTIVWTLEAEPLGADLTRFASETRVRATDEQARVKFRRYWRRFGIGILMIRWLMQPAVRRQAERRWRSTPEDR